AFDIAAGAAAPVAQADDGGRNPGKFVVFGKVDGPDALDVFDVLGFGACTQPGAVFLAVVTGGDLALHTDHLHHGIVGGGIGSCLVAQFMSHTRHAHHTAINTAALLHT